VSRIVLRKLTVRPWQLHVCVSGFDGGIDTYTIRNALPQMGLKPSPDISLLGSKRMIKYHRGVFFIYIFHWFF
jgi:hypothetical protein